MKWLRRLYLRIIPHYRVADRMEFDLDRALEMVDRNEFVPESQRWYLADDEWNWDEWNWVGAPRSRVMMERRERIWE